jgi:hypothetical protein
LREKLTELETTMSEKILRCVEEAVRLSTAPLKEELNKAHTEISRLKSIINKDSSNSSKPPRTDGYKQIPNSREKSGKSQGGQKGHPGHRLRLPKNIEELEAKGIVERRVVDHTGGSCEYVSKFTIDLQMKVVVTEHRFLKGEVPDGYYNEVSYGDNIKAQSVLLMAEGIISHKRLSEIISGMTYKAVKLSTGTLSKFQSDFAVQLSKSGELNAIKNDLLNGEIMHTDDTSMRVLKRVVYPQDDEADEPLRFEVAEGGSYGATIRTHSNERSTLYTVNPRKNQKGVERDGILRQYMGTLCHDHEAKFFNYGKENAGCGSHLTRDLKGLLDSYNCRWADQMRRFILGMNVHKNNDLTSGLKTCNTEKMAWFENEYTRLIEQGREAHRQMNEDEWGRNEFNAMLNRLSKYKDSYMLFMRNYKVPFTNNLAERDLRSEKTKEKVSGMFRSWSGIEDHVKVRSFISTLKKRGMDIFSGIKLVMQQEPVLSG